MAHAAPSTARGAAGPGGKGLAALRRHTTALRMATLLAVVYGLWAFAIQRHAGPMTWQNVVFGVVCAVVVGGLCLAVHAVSPRLRTEPRALLWGVFAGGAFAFLYSQSGHSVHRDILMGLLIGASVAISMYYYFLTRSPKRVE